MIQLAGVSGLALCLAAGTPVVAQESDKSGTAEITKASDAKTKSKPKVKTKGRTFTNADLDRMYGPSPEETEPPKVEVPDTPSGTTQPAGDAKSPLELLQEQQKSQQERQTKIAEAEKKLEDARQRVTDLEKRRLAVSNPFLARPKTPEDEEEAKKWEGMNTEQRRNRTDEQLEAAKQAVRDAEAELSALRRGS